MTDQPNKPAGAVKDNEPTAVADRQAVRNQGSVKPEDYPKPATGDATPK